jgi:hypothetical protein
VVAEYVEAMEAGEKFPPIVVYHDGTEYFCADGFHRILAAQRSNRKVIAAEVTKGTRQDALIYALGANRTNGLRRTNADKRHCVEIALKEFPDWSNRRIADACGVSDPTVAAIREEHVQTFSTSSTPAVRTGRDGKQYPAHARSSRAPRLIESDSVSRRREVQDISGAGQPSIGLRYANNAISLLRQIATNDLEYRQALMAVQTWIKSRLEESPGTIH